MDRSEPDWPSLKEHARRASAAAYAPYSRHCVGAVVVTGSGAVHAGCNVENASLGLTCCAERNALAAAVLAGATDLRAVVIYTPGRRPWSPCGACRQVMSELLAPETIVLSCADTGPDRQWSVAELLPDAFALQRD